MIGMIIITIICLLMIGELTFTRIGTNSAYIKLLIVGISGLIFTFVPYVFTSLLPIFIFTLIFGAITILSRKYELFAFIKSESQNRNYGAQLYPWVMFVMFYVQLKLENPLIFALPMLFMSVCDSAAFAFGNTWNWKPFMILGQKKTLSGSIAFFILAVICSFLLLNMTFPDALWTSMLPFVLILALSTTVVEAISINGYDNLTVPFFAMGVMYFLMPYFLA